ALTTMLTRVKYPTLASICLTESHTALHDRGRSGAWAFLMIVAWMLLAGNWAILPGVWQWAVGCFVPTLILVMMLIDLGAFVGTQGENKYGKDTQDVKYKADNKSSN
uniref:DUF805 domain-containing protein n=3 Tax=Shigella TaxID=620 RepID=UPI003CE7F4CF